MQNKFSKCITFLLSIFFLTMSINTFAITEDEKINASKTIELTNIIIELSNKYHTATENINTILDNGSTNVKVLSKNPQGYKNFMDKKSYSVVFAKPDEKFTNLYKEIEPTPDIKEVFTSFTNSQLLIEDSIKAVDELSDYFNNDEYKKDNFAKYQTLHNSTIDKVEAAEKAWLMSSDLAYKLGIKAELILLQDDPLADFLIPMKKDFADLDYFYDKLSKNKTLNAEEISRLTKLTETIQLHKDEQKNWDKLSDIYYKEVYETLYGKFNNLVNELTSANATISKGEKLTEDSFNMAQMYYNEAVEEYNTFIAQ